MLQHHFGWHIGKHKYLVFPSLLQSLKAETGWLCQVAKHCCHFCSTDLLENQFSYYYSVNFGPDINHFFHLKMKLPWILQEHITKQSSNHCLAQSLDHSLGSGYKLSKQISMFQINLVQSSRSRSTSSDISRTKHQLFIIQMTTCKSLETISDMSLNLSQTKFAPKNKKVAHENEKQFSKAI